MKNRELKTDYLSVQERRSKSYPQSNDFLHLAGKAFATMLIGVATFSCANAQTEKVYLKGAQRGMSVDLVTGNYGDAHELAKKEEATASEATPTSPEAVKKGAVVNSPAGYIHGEDKYLKDKEDGKRYGEFEVYDINGKDKDHVVLGLLTNTLDREKRFDDKGNLPTNMTLVTTTMDKLDDNGVALKSGEQVRVSAIRFNDKILVIVGNNDYRYIDGKKIVGETKLTDALGKGKPITEMTFFYELQSAGYVKNMTSKQFALLSLNEKERMLNNGQVAGL